MVTTNREELRAAFKEAYASLNAAQKQAVDTIEGPVMVIAGPGTGKTQILTLRIANILLQTDTAPESILALTFTEAGAKNMRERLRRFVGSDAYRISIQTFHGFAGDLIRDYPDAYPYIIGGQVATDLNRINLLTGILNNENLKQLRPIGNPTYYLKPIINELSELKRENVLPNDLAKIITKQEATLEDTEQYHEKGAHKGKVRGEYTKLEKSIAKNRELLTVYRSYEAAKKEQGLYDFEDMIVSTIAALENNEDMLRDLQEKYQYLLADEHQDVNASQNKIIELLANYHERPNVFAVGDEKQAIYRFQGASLENFLYFEDLFPGTKVITLTENYRSGQNILDTAHSLVVVEDGPLKELRIPLKAALVDDCSIEKREYSHEAVEHEDLVGQIKYALEHDVVAKEIAVIVRTNHEVETVSSLLRGAGLAVNSSADSDILNHPITVQIENLIDAVVEPTKESTLFAVLHGRYWGLSLPDLLAALNKRSFDTSLVDLLSSEATLVKVKKVIEEANAKSITDSPQRVLSYILEASGFLDMVMDNDPVTGARVVRRLYDEIESLVEQGEVKTLQDVARLIASYREHKISLNAPYIGNDDNAVNVMTAHKAKGLEFQMVFLPHLVDSVWGRKARRNNFSIPYTKHQHDEYDDLDDERRLLYVALTRAKTMLVLSYSEKNTAGKDLLESRLVSEMDAKSIELIKTEEIEKEFDPTSKLLNKETNAISTDFILEHLKARGFSATSLNNYLRSPWDWLYRNVLYIPEIQPLHMMYGTAIHNVLETLANKTEVDDINQATKYLESALAKLPLSTEEYTQLHAKGLETLVVYLPHFKNSLTDSVKTELKIKVVLETGLPEIPELPLTGMFDRLDLDKSGQLIRVVDYKTGKPKTRNAIEGKTQSDDGGYKRQLVFYALLLSLYDDERYQSRDMVLSFVQPDSKALIHEELFTITDDEIRELKETIIDTVRLATAGEWLNEPVESGTTDYEHLVKLLQEK